MSELYIGLMSGTSMDGIDAALVECGQHTVKLISHHSHTLPQALREKLLVLCLDQPGTSLDALGEADAELGDLFADAVIELLKQNGKHASEIKAIGSHGQTVRHKPDLHYPFSLQIADANRIAYKTGITTIADFRRKDIAAGGQGAPLAPAFHNAFFRSTDENRAVLNIGGIANITCLPSQADSPCFGFDTGPGNMLMDSWVQKHQQKNYDKNGAWAASAVPSQELVNQLMKDNFLHQSPPKSTGREHYNLSWLENQLKAFPGLENNVIQASLCQFTAQSISESIKRFLPDISTLIVCGGGAHNQYLMQQLESYLLDTHITTSEHFGLPADWVEAAAFAWLAKQTLDNHPGNLPEVTGARQSVVLGAIFPA